jgi:hypothetical protein
VRVEGPMQSEVSSVLVLMEPQQTFSRGVASAKARDTL